MKANTTYLSLGTNLGDKEKNINEAIKLIKQKVGDVIKVSSVIETEPWGFESNNSFFNTVLCCSTHLSPQQLLKETQNIETQIGRTKKTHNNEYQDRLIDIDILLYNDMKINDNNLKIPHPFMLDRDFVTTPLQEITDKQTYQNIVKFITSK